MVCDNEQTNKFELYTEKKDAKSNNFVASHTAIIYGLSHTIDFLSVYLCYV